MKINKIHKITGIGLLIAISFVLTIIGNNIAIGPVAINLSLIPIAIGAIIYGPIAGLIIGMVNGVAVLLAPTTATFLSHSAIFTIITCLTKTGLAGLISGLLFKLFKKVNYPLAVVLACICIPLVNTSIFCLCVFLFFYNLLLKGQGSNAFTFFCLFIVGWNFVFEVIVSSVLSPTLIYVTKVISKKEQNE
jgi:uncharacterized membrane protein